MKHLNDYINEHRIDEGGLRDTLFGEIVMKILGTGLDWIGKSVGWLADSFKGAVRQGWDSFKNVNSEVWHSYCRDTGFKFNRPRNEKEYGLLASQIIDSNKTYEEKFDAIERLDSITNGQTDMMCVTICKLCLTNAGNKDITKKHLEVYITDLQDLLKKYKNKIGKHTRHTIEETINTIEKRIKEVDTPDDNK